jgi:hypothetical protein
LYAASLTFDAVACGTFMCSKLELSLRRRGD